MSSQHLLGLWGWLLIGVPLAALGLGADRGRARSALEGATNGPEALFMLGGISFAAASWMFLPNVHVPGELAIALTAGLSATACRIYWGLVPSVRPWRGWLLAVVCILGVVGLIVGALLDAANVSGAPRMAIELIAIGLALCTAVFSVRRLRAM